eukprot:scaffold100465_cov18-Tisochrysis_lutea.AAC.3
MVDQHNKAGVMAYKVPQVPAHLFFCILYATFQLQDRLVQLASSKRHAPILGGCATTATQCGSSPANMTQQLQPEPNSFRPSCSLPPLMLQTIPKSRSMIKPIIKLKIIDLHNPCWLHYHLVQQSRVFLSAPKTSAPSALRHPFRLRGFLF